jgi:hypothetical protein
MVTALSSGAACLFALVKRIDSGAPCLAADRATWASALTALEEAMVQLRTDPLVTSGYDLTPEDVARVRVLRERLQGGEGSSDLRPLAVMSLEKLSGPDWVEKMRRAAQLAEQRQIRNSKVVTNQHRSPFGYA